jgi:molybdate transport system regulatory protein
MIQPQLKLKLVMGEQHTLLGPGKIALLHAIVAEHSLSRAAKSIGMSYRRAWLLIQELNDSLREPVLITQTGGQAGGGSVLTPMAFELIALYDTLTQEAEAATEQTRNRLASMIKTD